MKRLNVRKFGLPLLGTPQALPVTLQHCERLSARLTVSACVERYRKGNSSSWAAGIAAQFITCHDCPVGRHNAFRDREISLDGLDVA